MLKKLFFIALLVVPLFILSIPMGAVQSQASELPPLTEPGPYGVRMTKVTFTDPRREGWTLEVRIWYPADKAKGTPVSADGPMLKDGPPDRSGAPYPLIVYSHGWTSASLEWAATKAHLASYGYVVASPQHHDTDPFRHEFVDRPLDIMLLMDGLAAITEGDLVGMIDTNNVGLMGLSLGGDTVFQMLGLLSDPLHLAKWCAEHPDLDADDCYIPPVAGQQLNVFDETTAYRAQLGLKNESNGQWAPFGDKRIHAVLALEPGDFPLTTEDMLAAVTTPTMILHGSKDETNSYEGNAVRTYTYLGTQDRYLITLVNGVHMTISTAEHVPQHFATAFFGRYLKGDTAYAPYLTAEGLPVWRAPKLFWGPYEVK